jgi:hypothetical protein
MTTIADDDLGPLQPTRATAADLGVCTKSVERFRREIPDFPKPVKIRGRNYDYVREIQRWKRQRAAAGASRDTHEARHG